MPSYKLRIPTRRTYPRHCAMPNIIKRRWCRCRTPVRTSGSSSSSFFCMCCMSYFTFLSSSETPLFKCRFRWTSRSGRARHYDNGAFEHFNRTHIKWKYKRISLKELNTFFCSLVRSHCEIERGVFWLLNGFGFFSRSNALNVFYFLCCKTLCWSFCVCRLTLWCFYHNFVKISKHIFFNFFHFNVTHFLCQITKFIIHNFVTLIQPLT